jgi:hypothetical protein
MLVSSLTFALRSIADLNLQVGAVGGAGAPGRRCDERKLGA